MHDFSINRMKYIYREDPSFERSGTRIGISIGQGRWEHGSAPLRPFLVPIIGYGSWEHGSAPFIPPLLCVIGYGSWEHGGAPFIPLLRPMVRPREGVRTARRSIAPVRGYFFR